MDNRQRFYESLHYGAPDRLPYFEEGIREDTLEAWKEQGHSVEAESQELFKADLKEEIKIDLIPIPGFRKWPKTFKELESLEKHLGKIKLKRVLPKWKKQIKRLREREHLLMVRAHEGFFLSMGVGDARTFTRLMYQIMDEPDFVREFMRVMGLYAAKLTEQILREVEVDALIFSEPIGSNTGALISPQTYESLVLPSYEPLLASAREHGVHTIICRTYANIKALIPSLLKWGIDCLWACEVEQTVMNYPSLRQTFGRELKLIGGIDLDALRRGPEAIRAAIQAVAPLTEEGGYIPLADGRVRADVSYENYIYYRELLKTITHGGYGKKPGDGWL
jgi:uroporphyrinogen-III decarboxylase